MTDDEYAGEVVRVVEILAKFLPEWQAVNIVSQLEASAKEADRLVAHLLSRPDVINRYDVDSYDGIELKSRSSVEFSIHFIRSGSWSMKNLDVNSLMAFSSFDSQRYRSDMLLEWFRKDLEFTKLRLDELDRSGTISILDKEKVRIVVLPEFKKAS